ncbi:MAG: ornithine carbamoyltransferase [Deinococcota bacterium]
MTPSDTVLSQPQSLAQGSYQSSLRGGDLVSLSDLSPDAFFEILDIAADIKQRVKQGEQVHALAGKSLAMLFEKPSLRTRSTFDVGMFQLGGHAVLLDQQFVGIGKRESLRDVASNLERWFDGIMARTFAHSTVEMLAQHAHVPVINGLTDLVHPCQLLADYLTLRETFSDLSGLHVVFVGDGNNVVHSHIYAALLAGTTLTVACPEGYEPHADIVAAARDKGATINISHDPRDAVQGADVLYTDVWTSMGQEAETAARLEAFAGYTVTADWLNDLAPTGVFMHDLPAHYGEECTEDVLYSPRSVVFDQAENRLHAQKGLLVALLG